MNRIIEYYKPSQSIKLYEEPYWRYYPQKVSFWNFLNLNFFKQLDCFCQWWLNRRGKFSHLMAKESLISYTKHVIDCDNIVREIFDSSDLIREIYNERPKYLILGCKHIRALDMEVHQKFMFSFPANYTAPLAGKPGIERMFAGMRVVCIPWMEGAIVLPELE